MNELQLLTGTLLNVYYVLTVVSLFQSGRTVSRIIRSCPFYIVLLGTLDVDIFRGACDIVVMSKI